MPSWAPSISSLFLPTILFLTLFALPATATAAGSIAVTRVVSGLAQPTDIQSLGDGSGRLAVAERAGRVRMVLRGELDERPFLDLTDRVLADRVEEGLLGLAFPPGPGPKSHFYAFYVARSERMTLRVSRFAILGDRADVTSEQVILTLPHPGDHHFGGQIAFGPLDGFLYVAVGDGGTGLDPDASAQNLTTQWGKILRIDVESGTDSYLVPPTNPFIGGSANKEIWAFGLRNPWRFAFDRLTGDMFIADVGQSMREEINHQAGGAPGGVNYGWPIVEGTVCYHPTIGCDPSGTVPPIIEYHNGRRAEGCALIGGKVYRGSAYPRFQGAYLNGDLCTGVVRAVRRGTDGAWTSEALGATGLVLTAFGEDERGELYVTDYASGSVYALADACVTNGGVEIPRLFANRTFLPGAWRGCGLG